MLKCSFGPFPLIVCKTFGLVTDVWVSITLILYATLHAWVRPASEVFLLEEDQLEGTPALDVQHAHAVCSYLTGIELTLSLIRYMD